jgi:hypothetical protein
MQQIADRERRDIIFYSRTAKQTTNWGYLLQRLGNANFIKAVFAADVRSLYEIHKMILCQVTPPDLQIEERNFFLTKLPPQSMHSPSIK